MNQLYSKAVSFILKGTNHLFLTFIVVVSKYLRNIKCLNFEETKGKRLLVIRHGGLGDLIFMIPSLRKIKNLHPGIQITVMTRGCNFELFQHVPYVDRVIKHAWPNLFSLFCHDYVVFLDNSVESDPDAKTVNIYDLFAEKYFGILLEKHEKNPFLTFNYWDCVELDEVITFPSSNRLRKIGIQLRAGSPVRTPAPVFWTHLISTMLEERSDSVIYLIVEARFCEYAQTIINGLVAPSIQKRVVNMARYAGGVSRLINMIALMDLVVVPDSSAAHIAAGLGVPLVGIYGPFPGQLRVKYYPEFNL